MQRVKGTRGHLTSRVQVPYNRVRVTLRSRIEAVGEIGSAKEYWEKRILRTYDAWLEAYKGAELEVAWRNHDDGDGGAKKWHLLIGFQRDESILTAWGGVKTGDRWVVPFASEQVALHLTCSSDDGGVQASSEPLDAPLAAWLALDNHGRALARVDPSAIAAYHPFSGSGQMTLYQSLQTPPEDTFLRSMLILSAAEALLTRILIVDERVAGASLAWLEGEPVGFHSALIDMHRARIHPVFNVHMYRRDTSHGVRDHVHCLVKSGNLEFLPPEEGLHFYASSRDAQADPPAPIVNLVAAANTEPRRLEALPDFIILHEGLVDVLSSGDGPAWTDDTHGQLYRLAPCIVRTSGRGSAARHLAGQQPFLEFSELSETTYRVLNKMALTKTLLSLAGL